jgi:predicted nuclease of predicted toxin-antitoxin system
MVPRLEAAGIESVHVAEVGLSEASDADILEYARREGLVVVTLDADFHALMALSAACGPSVVRVRIEGLKAEGLARFLARVVSGFATEVDGGALVSVGPHRVGVRKLPLAR